ncbi:MAG TPA: DNA polymerase III subunit alpha [Gemmatimonadaceae bacterium]
MPIQVPEVVESRSSRNNASHFADQKSPLRSNDRNSRIDPRYVELRAHTCFSFSDGAVSAEDLPRHARLMGYTHIGVSDTADLGGIARFATEAMAPGKFAACPRFEQHSDEPCPLCERPIRPIIGAELVVDGYPAAFIARSPEGYQNLAALVTLARMGQWDDWVKESRTKQRGRPKVKWSDVVAHSQGLNALTGPATGELASWILKGKSEQARKRLKRWRDVFAPGMLSIEVQLHHTGGHEAALAAELIELAEESGVPWVATQDPRYVDDADGRGQLVHDLLTALRYNVDVETAAQRGLLHPNNEWRLLSPAEMANRWRGREEGLRESMRIAEECSEFTSTTGSGEKRAGFVLDWMRPPLPDFSKAKIGASLHDVDDNEALRAQAEEGARNRWGGISPDQQQQIDHELKLIRELGFAGFFLVMADAVRFARSKGILCQGRGSAANSVVAYCTSITAVDPVENGLLFERFLSDARVNGRAEPPDIDVDFEHNRREDVLNYMYDNYHREHAAITAVTQMFHAPTAVQDAMRALGFPAEQALEISKRVHGSEPSECSEEIVEIAEKRGVDLGGARGKALMLALPGFEGLARLRSTHVGGFVLSGQPLGNYLPIEQTTMGRTIVQYDKDDLDMIGVPKFDFLGLGALSMVRIAFDVIEQHSGERPDMYKFKDRDAKTYDLIQRGETIGTFQIESRAQINSILHTKPDHLYDLVVQVALIRPGPIQASFVHPYTQRRLGLERMTFAHPDLAPVLRRTQGIPIFQEQAMAIAMKLGGYSATEADLLRRTMGNVRKKTRLEAALEGLKKAMLKRDIVEGVATKICEDLVSFANYGFPESHAWSFALIAYVTAYLKAHYATEFFIGLLNAQPMGFYPISTLIHDAIRHGVRVLPPCLATGSWECTFVRDVETRSDEEAAAQHDNPARVEMREDVAMRVGWKFVRGIGSGTIDRMKEIHKAGPFTSIPDVVERVKLDRGDVLAFAQAGAFAAWAPDRRHAAWEGLRASGDILPLAPAKVSYHEPVPVNRDQLIHLDYHAVGMSIYGHPMEALRERLAAGGATDSRQLAEMPNRRVVTVCGLVTIRQRPATAGGTIFLLLEDEWGYMNIVVPQPLVAPNEEVVKRAPFVIVQGRVENDGAAISVVGQKFRELVVGERLTHHARSFR